jgi:predicted kinase
MECVIFVGIQGSGKSGFFKSEFADTHVRINRDMLRTRNREAQFFELCLTSGQQCVIDNTNPTVEERARFIGPAKQRGFRLVGYFFDVPTREALARNAARPEKQRVPVPGIFATAKRMKPPTLSEGFDALFRVRFVEGRLVVSSMNESVLSPSSVVPPSPTPE